MASSPKCFSFLLVSALFFIQIYARDFQFFSKVFPTPVNPTTTTVKEESLNKQEPEPEPSFIQETQNVYDLYAQESALFPTTPKLGSAPYTTTTNPTAYIPYRTQTEAQETYTNTNNYYNNENYGNIYDEQQRNLDENTLQPSSYTTTANQNNNNKYYSFNGGQGMSDTRYLENGKYYYENHKENNYYDTRDYYNNNNNNEKTCKYTNYNSQEELQDNQDGQYDP